LLLAPCLASADRRESAAAFGLGALQERYHREVGSKFCFAFSRFLAAPRRRIAVRRISAEATEDLAELAHDARARAAPGAPDAAGRRRLGASSHR
jgi:hypothetical protein